MDESVLSPEFNPHAHFEPWCKRMLTELWYLPPAIDSRGVVRSDKADRPSKRQIEEHALENHATYRSWCPVCVEAKSTGSKHRARTQQQKEERGPTIHADFFYMSTDEGSAPFLALKSEVSGRLHAVALETKSPIEYTQKAFARFVEETGHKRVVFMSDSEPALVKLKEETAARLKNVEVIQRTSPVGDHRSNGNAEVAVREIKKQMRTIRIALEQKLGCKLSDTNPIWHGWHHLQLTLSIATGVIRQARRPLRRSSVESGLGQLWSLES